VRIEFDPRKNALNLRKHGVELSEGDGVLADPMAVTIEDLSPAGEQRFATIGTNAFGAVMVVVWAARHEIIRIISVRRARPKGRSRYEEGV
jgi:uncharacterized DUF497 family protein